MKAEDFLEAKDAMSFLDSEKAPAKTSVWEDVKTGLANTGGTLDTAVSMLAGGAASLFGQEDDRDDIFKKLDERLKNYQEWANPDKKKQGVAGKTIGALATLPLQIATFPLSPFSTGKTAIDAGESLGKARLAQGIDTLGNLVGVAAPGSKGLTVPTKIVTGGAINAAQDVATKMAIQSALDTEKGKAAFDPTLEDAMVAGITGAGMGAMFRNGDQGKKAQADQFKKIAEIQKAKEAAAAQKPVTPETKIVPDELDLFGPDQNRVGLSPFETDRSAWKTDENGIPYKEDLSQELGRAERVGGETGDLFETPRTLSEVDREAELAKQADIDRAFQENPQSNERVLDARAQEAERIQTEQQLHELEQSLRQSAYTPDLQGQGPKTRAAKAQMNRGMRRGQGGAIDFSILDEPLRRFKRSLKGASNLLHGDDGEVALVFRGTNEPDKHNFNEGRSSYATFVSDNPYLASAFVRDPFDKTKPYGAVGIMGIRNDVKVIDFPVKNGNFDKFAFDEAAKRLPPNTVLRARNGRDSGPGSWEEPFHRQMANNDQYAAKDPSVFVPFSELKKTNPGLVEPSDWKDRYVAAKEKNITTLEKVLSEDFPKEEMRKVSLDFPGREPWEWNAYRAGLEGELERQQKDLSRTGMRRKQSGALDMSILDPLFAKTKALAKAVGDLGDYIPNDPDVDAVLPLIRGEKDVAWSTSKNLESGGTSAAMNRRSSAVMVGSRIVQNAMKRADLAVKKFVFPTEDSFRRLNKTEIETVMDIIKTESFMNQRFTLDELQSAGLSVKQMQAYNQLRQMNAETLRIQNEARAAAGKKPITELEAYAASTWQGDFKQPVRNAKGELVWYLAADTARGVRKQWEALQKLHPELTMDPKEAHRASSRVKGSSLESAYTTMLDILGRDDPAVKEIQDAYEKLQAEQAENMLGQTKHFKNKTGVRGFVGDRPGKNPKAEALAYIQSQIQYSKNAMMWAEMQKAGENFKKLVSDPELNEKQPNNVAYLKDYWKTNLGFGEHKVFRALDEALRDAGVSPIALAKAIGNTKAFFIMQKLALSPGYIASNFLQTTSILPHMVDMYNKGYTGNPIKALAVGTPIGLVTAAQHWFGASGEKQALLATLLPGDSRFFSEAIKYAEDNGVVSRSSYDESPIESSLSIGGRVGNFVGKASMSYPESVIRSVTFMSAAQQLRDSGKFKNNAELFQRAEEMVNMSMVDYRSGERPMIFAKAGTMGNALNTLQTFPASFYNQWRYFGKEALRGNPAPFVTAFALQYALAGAMGIPGVADVDKLWQFLKARMPASWWAKTKNNEFLADPKLWAIKNFGEASVYGALSDYSGVAMTSRMSAPSFSDMAAAPVGPIADIAGQVGSAASLAMDPTDPTKQAQAAMNSAPVGFQGLVEQQAFPGETGVELPNGKRGVFNSRKLGDRENVYSRSPEEQTIRNFGVRSQRETATKEARYRTDYNKQISREKAGDVADQFYQAIRRGDKEKALQTSKLYLDLSGEPLKDSQVVMRLKKEFIDAIDRQAQGIKTVEDVRRYKMLKEVLNELD